MELFMLLWSLLIVANSQYSGFYAWNRTEPTIAEDYAGAWLVSKQRFLRAENGIAASTGIEHGCFAVLRHKCPNCETLFTRDYFDFMAEHLSSTTNLFPEENQALFNVTVHRLTATVSKLKKQGYSVSDPRTNSTLAMIVYSSISSTATPSAYQVRIRQLYLQATFYSIARYFPSIVVVVANSSDASTVKRLDIPVKDIITVKVPLSEIQQTELLPKTALQYVLQRVKSDINWQWVKYVYYSEGDILLHLRNGKQLFSVMGSNEDFALVPHRMQTFPLKHSYSKSLQSLWARQGSRQPQNLLPDHLTLVTEDLQRSRGSCCDDGRNLYQSCGNWWYHCRQWGLMNLTTWLRLGRSGFTFPASTEHGTVCRYSREKVLCGLSEGCRSRVPSNRSQLCLEVNKVRHIP